MAILSKEEFLSKVNTVLGSRSDEEAINFLEDMADTYNELEAKAKGTGEEDWKQKYEENDKAWQEKYRRRFMSGGGSTVIEEKEESEPEVTAETITIEDIFQDKE